MRKVKSACDVAVVSFHFGEVPQHTSQIRQSQIRAAHAAIDAGADLVLGHHPHVVSGIELYKDRYVFYDLGSVQSSGKHFRYHNMVAASPWTVDTQTGKITCLPPVIYPGFTSGAGRTGLNNCQPVLYTPDDPGYETVFGIIDEASSHKKSPPAPTSAAFCDPLLVPALPGAFLAPGRAIPILRTNTCTLLNPLGLHAGPS